LAATAQVRFQPKPPRAPKPARATQSDPFPPPPSPPPPRLGTPNWWKIQQYCQGSVDNASPSNEFCFTCEPPYSNETLGDFDIFPEPAYSPTWQQALSYVAATAGGAAPPTWDTIENGQNWTDPATGITVLVPGSNLPWQRKRDPYADAVSLAKDLGCAGIDLDYEEMWHADEHKTGPAGGPWNNDQTVYKFAAILKDVQLNIAAQAPGMLLSTAAGAAGGWSGNWWGGNLKGLVLKAASWYPDLLAFVASTGGVNVMTYDLSSDVSSHTRPDPQSHPKNTPPNNTLTPNPNSTWTPGEPL
jgi:hypothetical protein